ncbi:G2/mitotic-specific cyclin S13-6 [Glycine soja]
MASSPIVGGVVAAKRMAPKPDQKKVVLKSKPEEVIDIKASPNKKEVLKEKKKEGDSNFKKKSHHTLTSVLNARSKAAWGITNKLNERIIDIDSDDVDDELAVVEFHTKFNLLLETLYLTINIVDRFLAYVYICCYLYVFIDVGLFNECQGNNTCLELQVGNFVCLSDRAYTHEQILVMDKIILAKLEWTLTMPTPLLVDVHTKLELSLETLYLTINIIDRFLAVKTVPRLGMQLQDCARLLVSFHSTVGNREEKVVYLKYSDPEKGVVAMLPPAKNLLPEGEAVVEGGKQQKKNGVADGRNRKALGDIGNLANIRSAVEVKPNRPITRSFGAQLLANAQAAAAAGNNKKQACANVAGPPAVANGGVAVAKRVAPKPGPKKVTVTVKPKPEEVIDIEASPDKKEVLKDKKNEGDANSKKKSQHTLTSVLTARSKAACGITNKPKEQIIDIDASDVDNELAAVEYIDDIYKFYKLVENESHPHDYIDSQPEINERMRAILVDWLIDVHTKFELSLETLYLTINIIDRFLAVKTVPRRELQLVGISAMLMASKYEEIWPPEVNDFVCLSDRAYTHEQILAMEKTILNKLEWTLTVPTPFVFLVRFIKAAVPDQELENMAHFMSELGMMNYATLMYCPSMVAASAVFAARCTLNKAPLWNETLKLHTGYSQEQLMDCARLLVGFHSTLGNGKLRVVYRKYSDPQKGAVAVLPPAKLLPEGSASQHS